MQKVKKLITLVLLGGAGLAAWLYFSGSAQNELVLYGNVDQRQVELAFIDSERVAEVLVQEGERVRPGQLLARLETRRLNDKIAVAKARVAATAAALDRLKNGTRPEEIDRAAAAVASARAELAFAQAQHKRYADIWKKSSGQAVSKQDLDEAQLRLNVAAAKLLEEQKNLRLAEIGPRQEDIAQAEALLQEQQSALEELCTQLADAELKSPAHSIVNRRLLEPGDLALPQKAAFSLAVLSPKWVRAYVAEADLGRVRPGQPAYIYTDSHPEQALTGTVGFISSVAEFTPKTVETTDLRTSLVYEIRVYVEDAEDALRLGMPATLRFAEKAEKTE